MPTKKEITWLFKALGLSKEKDRKRIASLGDKYHDTVKKPEQQVGITYWSDNTLPNSKYISDKELNRLLKRLSKKHKVDMSKVLFPVEKFIPALGTQESCVKEAQCRSKD